MFETAEVHVSDHPFRHVAIDRVFAPEHALSLARSFPELGFRHSRGVDGHYELWDRSLIDEECGRAPADDLSPRWRELLDDLDSAGYRDTIAALCRVELARARIKVRLCRYLPGGWMLPHTDRDDRIVSQIIYFHEQWTESWGGALRILRSAHADDVERELVPRFNSSVLLVRSDRSFHAVTPVAAVAAARCSLLVQFLRR